MHQPLRITFHGVQRSDAVEALLHDRVAELDARHPGRILSCHATVEASHHYRHGRLYRIHLDIRVRDKQIVVTRPRENHAHEDVYVAVRDAFDAATRQLDEHLRRRADAARTVEGDTP